MKIAVIGIGYLGSGVVEALAKRGHKLRLIDIQPIKAKHEFVRCNVLHEDALELALKSNPPFDVVYTTVGAPYSFENQVIGCFNTLQAAKKLGISKVVLTGSEAARGQRNPNPMNVEICNEETPAKPDYVYALSKYLIEIIAEYFWRVEGVRTIVLRNGWFGSPRGRTIQEMGSMLLIQRAVTREDMIRAAVLAIENQSLEHEVFLLCNSTDFTKEDIPTLRTNPAKVIEKYYGLGAVKLLKEYSIDIEALHKSGAFSKIDDISKAERLLGWKPTFTFRDFFENLKAGKYSKDYIFYI